MKLAAADWATALRLLDEALERPPVARLEWLESLPAEHRRLLPALRQLLDDRRAIETGDFLQALPPLPAIAMPAGFAIGHRIGPWRLLRELGSGGMASVWLAERTDGAHKREVALKLPWLGARARVIGERFGREREILSALTHPHIASVLDAGVDGAQPWLALEYVQGQPLTVHARALGLNTVAKLRLFLQVLQAVQHAHAQLVIHRDLKPSNVMVDEQGQVKLLDFGVAKLLDDDGASRETELTRLGGRAMTPQYASPEQVAGHALGTASDVYSLGVLLYELLTGKLPYSLKRDTPAALEEAILTSQVLRPSQAVAGDKRLARMLRGDVDTIVLKAMARQVRDRYGSVEAMADDIGRHLGAMPILAQAPSWSYLCGKFARRHTAGLVVAGVVVLLTAAGVTTTLWQAHRAEASARASEASARKAETIKLFLSEVLATLTSGEFAASPEMRERMTTALRRKMEEAKERFARNPADRAAVHEVLGNLFAMIDATGDAQAAWTEALGAHEAAGSPRDSRATALIALSSNAFNERDHAAQRQYLERALHVFDGTPLDAQERRTKGLALAELGDSLLMVHQMERAKNVLAEGRDLLEAEADAGKTMEYAFVRRGLGLVALLTGQREPALEHYRAAVAAVLSDAGAPIGERTRLTYELAKAEAANGLSRDAEGHARAAVDAELRESGESQSLPVLRVGLAEALAAQSRFDEADTLFDQALAGHAGGPPQGDVRGLFRSRLSAASAALDHGDLRRADRLLSQTRAMLSENWVLPMQRVTFWRQSAVLHSLRGETAQALAASKQALEQQTALDPAFDEQRAQTSLLLEHMALDAGQDTSAAPAAWVNEQSVDPLVGQRIGTRFVQARRQVEQRRFDSAATDLAGLLREYQSLEPQRRRPQTEARLQLELGRALAGLGRTEEAQHRLNQASTNLVDQHVDSPRRAPVRQALSTIETGIAR